MVDWKILAASRRRHHHFLCLPFGDIEVRIMLASAGYVLTSFFEPNSRYPLESLDRTVLPQQRPDERRELRVTHAGDGRVECPQGFEDFQIHLDLTLDGGYLVSSHRTKVSLDQLLFSVS